MGEFKVGVKSLILYHKKVLLIQRTDHAGIDEGAWEYPGGIVEFGEDLHTALRREIKEETNLDVCIGVLLFAMTRKVSPQRQIVGLTYLSHANSDKVRISEEHKDFLWANKDQLVNLLHKPMLNYLTENSVLDSLEID